MSNTENRSNDSYPVVIPLLVKKPNNGRAPESAAPVSANAEECLAHKMSQWDQASDEDFNVVLDALENAG